MSGEATRSRAGRRAGAAKTDTGVGHPGSPGPNALDPARGSWLFDARRQDLVEILESLPCGMAVLASPFGKVRYINRQIVETLGYSLLDTPSSMALDKKIFRDRRNRRHAEEVWKKIVEAGGGTQTFAVPCGDGQIRTFEHRSVVLRKDLIIALWIDMTRREAAEAALRESEPRFASLFQESNDPFLLFDGNRLVNCNTAAQHLLDMWDKDRLLGLALEELSPEHQRDGKASSLKASLLLKAALKHGSLRSEWTLKRADGRELQVELSVAVVTVEEKSLFFVVARDITAWKQEHTALLSAKRELGRKVKERTSELVAVNTRLRAEIRQRKATERELRRSRQQLRELSEHLQQLGEEGRTHIAREVHDQLGQSLAALKIDLAELRGTQVETKAGLEGKVRAIEGQVNEIMRSVREICRELRPPLFDDLGLPSAILWYLRDFEQRTGIRCEAVIDEELSYQKTEPCLVLFRIFQESMSNVLRHARANRVRVGLRRAGDNLRLEVRDDGVGITEAQASDPSSLGILGIRERVRFRGGKLALRGRPGRGTRIVVSLPIVEARSAPPSLRPGARKPEGGDGS